MPTHTTCDAHTDVLGRLPPLLQAKVKPYPVQIAVVKAAPSRDTGANAGQLGQRGVLLDLPGGQRRAGQALQMPPQSPPALPG